MQRQHKQVSKTIGSLFLSSLVVFGLGGVKAHAATVVYNDVPATYWAYNSIIDLSQKGIATGVDSNFYPESNVTRAEFVKLLVKGLNLPLATDTVSSFSDVPTYQWYFPYIQTAYKANVVHGVSQKEFAPNAQISRQDMVMMLANALHLQNVAPDLLNAVLPFNDSNDIKEYAKSAVALSKELQLVTGTPQGDFQPNESSKRAEAAIVLDRMLYLPVERLQAMSATSFHPTTHLSVTLSSNQPVKVGYPVPMQVNLLDGQNQPTKLSQPVSVTLSVSDSTIGTLNNGTVIIPAGSSSIATTFLGGLTPGDVTVSATPSTEALANTLSGETKVSVASQVPSQLVSGKGIWLMWGDWNNIGADAIVAKAKANGMTHLYIEVATSWHDEGFYGPDALDDLLPKAHAAGLKVIGWTYDSLQNPANDAKVDISVAKYRTASGDMVDGLSPDIEDANYLNETSVTAYSTALRNALGEKYPMILCTYPSTWRPTYPWTTFGKYYDVIAPMDYWHNHDKKYSNDDVFKEITSTVQDIRKATGKPNIPVTLIGEGYDMFDDKGVNSPTADEVRSSMDAAHKIGAVGYSIYRWGTMTPDEWQAFGSYKW